MKELFVYNLEFPAHLTELNIGGYKFKRTEDYAKTFAGLQHTFDAIGSEFPIQKNTGTHQLTAMVEIFDKENNCILPWLEKDKLTALQDVILFLSLFTGRNVFVLNREELYLPLRPDPRQHFWGGQFRLSAHVNQKWRNKDTGIILSDEEMKDIPVFNFNRIDLGLEETINKILETISSPKWQDEYSNGYFIFTFRQAIRESDIEPAFLLCWTIWEHLFCLHNKKWLDEATINQINGDNKISFILHKYFLINIDNFTRKNIRRLTRARNRLIHFGQTSEDIDIPEMQMFIRITEQIISLVLGLQPSNALNSLDSLQAFLREK